MSALAGYFKLLSGNFRCQIQDLFAIGALHVMLTKPSNTLKLEHIFILKA